MTPALATFCNEVTTLLTSSLALPPEIPVPGHPQRIMRAVFGHLAALGVDRYLNGTDTVPLRDTFLDESIAFPAGIRFYYWPFAYQGAVLVRDAAYWDLKTGAQAAVWLMKFFPLSFLMTWEKTPDPMFALPMLSRYGVDPAGTLVDIPIPMRNIPHPYWPEAPTDSSVVLYGQEAIYSVPHLRS